MKPNNTFWTGHFGAEKGMKIQLIIQQVTAYVEHQYVLLVSSKEKLREFKKLIITRRSMMGVSEFQYFLSSCFTKTAQSPYLQLRKYF